MEEGVALPGIGHDRAVVPGDRLVEPAELLAFLRDSVEEEPVVGFGGEEREQAVESVGGGGRHRRCDARVAASGGRVLYSPMHLARNRTGTAACDPCGRGARTLETGGPRRIARAACASVRAAVHAAVHALFDRARALRARAGALAPAAAALFALVVSVAPVACTNDPAGTPVYDESDLAVMNAIRRMRVTSHVGGTHRALVVRDGVWFQSFENRMVMMDAATGAVFADLELAPRGTTGAVGSFALLGDRLFCVLDEDEVVEVDVTLPRDPRVVDRWGVAELVVKPRRVSVVDGEVFVSGDGGVVRLADTRPRGEWLDEKGKPLPPVVPPIALEGRDAGVVVAAVGGPVACVGRRIVRLADGAYLGAATHLEPLPRALGEGYAFILQSANGGEFGVMGGDFRVRASSALSGTVHATHAFGDRIYAVNDFEIATLRIEADPDAAAAAVADGLPPDALAVRLVDLLSVPVKGARDVARIRPNRFAVAGSFGRALYRFLPEGNAPGDTFYWAERVPGRLDACKSDRRRILAASREGAWLYLIGDKAELTDAAIAEPDRGAYAVESSWGAARLADDRSAVDINVKGKVTRFPPPRGGEIETLAIADGRIWVGHRAGIDAYGLDQATGEPVLEDRIVLSGPVFMLYPNRVGGGVSFVSQFGGMGLVRPVPVDAPPTRTPGTVDGSGARGGGAATGRGDER